MKLSKASKTLCLSTLAVLASPLAAAGDSGFYLGGNVGQSRAKIDDDRIRSSLLAAGFTKASIADNDRTLGYKLFGGYQFNRYFAVEGGAFDLGKSGFVATTTPPGTLSGDIRLKGLNLDLVGILPITEKFSAFGRGGVNYAEARDSFRSSGSVAAPPPNRSKRAANYKFGFGLQYDITKALGLRAEAERYRVDDAVGNNGDVDLLSLGLVYRFFGRAPAAVEHVDSAPEPVATAAAAPAVAPARTQEYCSILDIQFEINQDDIQRQEKEKLGVVGTFLNKYPATTAVIEGHTDNVGSAEDNRQLSQRRADSVAGYLRESFHLAPSRVTAVGYGDTRPVADNSTEEGKRMNRRINAVIACATDIEGLTVLPARMTVALEMEFDRNKADVRPQYRDQLGKVAAFMKTNPAVTATVEGHTANLQATEALAMEISRQRAQNVVKVLVDDFGIAPSRLSAVGFGETRRVAYNSSAEGQQENRRVNIIINYAH